MGHQSQTPSNPFYPTSNLHRGTNQWYRTKITYIHTHIYTHVYICIGSYIYIHTHTHTYIGSKIYIYTYIYLYIYIYVQMCIWQLCSIRGMKIVFQTKYYWEAGSNLDNHKLALFITKYIKLNINWLGI
jgi:hypothetical protein